MPVTAWEFQSGLRTIVRVGQRSSEQLESVHDLEEALEVVEEFAFPSVRSGAYWILRRYIVDPASGEPVLTATIGTPTSFSQPLWRQLGVQLLTRAIEVLESGAIGLGHAGSDATTGVSVQDLAYLQAQYDQGEAEGYFSLVGVIV